MTKTFTKHSSSLPNGKKRIKNIREWILTFYYHMIKYIDILLWSNPQITPKILIPINKQPKNSKLK